jgi:ADP-ribose pyrophosphatase YjhB (NUDIX family)
MPPTQKNRIAILKEEIDFIHIANYRYWVSPGGAQPRGARAEYARRRARLDETRLELMRMAPTAIR